MLKTLTTIHILALLAVSPYPITNAQAAIGIDTIPITHPPVIEMPAQNVLVSRVTLSPDVSRDNYTVTNPPKPKPKPIIIIAATAPQPKIKTSLSASVANVATGPTIPTSVVQQFAHDQVISRGWTEADYSCLVLLWNKESGWNYKADNASSGAYGIPQALPGSKMASAGADWATNGETQVTWGLNYISGSYGTPCNAWAHSESNGWY